MKINKIIAGAASTLAELRKDFEARTGLSGKELRIEKVCYTGKEGKTAQGCPMAKWVSVWIPIYCINNYLTSIVTYEVVVKIFLRFVIQQFTTIHQFTHK